ncbi:MAG: cysteine rich repeat-containing protein [Hyphomicrobiaceae bacterium]|nr:cysteine rich repeat-containing protein [Hyphomicrobiaceae bacterium]
MSRSPAFPPRLPPQASRPPAGRALLRTGLAALGILATATAAVADDREAARKACVGDYKKFCSGVMPGGGRVKKCLADNLASLEPACREIVARNTGDAKATQGK